MKRKRKEKPKIVKISSKNKVFKMLEKMGWKGKGITIDKIFFCLV